MTGATNKMKEISLGKDFGDVVIKVNDTRVEISASGDILAFTSGTVKAWSAANDITTKAPPSTEPRIGDKMPDGTIYAGISPDTGKARYAMPADAPLTYTFNEAQKYAQETNAQKPHGHDDWQVPTRAELNVLFNNRAAIGGFDVSGSDPSGWYWSSSSGSRWSAWGQRFSGGYQLYNIKDDHSSVRLVR